eukprot:GSChrysophyteH2.ASY1.ANO1.1096.1 assembled CDS
MAGKSALVRQPAVLCEEAKIALAERAAAGGKPYPEITPVEARNAAPPPLPSKEEVLEVIDLNCGGVPARFYRPSRNKEDYHPSKKHMLGLTIYFHGGGWVVGDIEKLDHVCRCLANSSGHCVLNVGYRLAPEHPYPTPLEDCLTATRWAHGHAESKLGCDSNRICVAGDSAGGNLAAVVANEACIPLRLQVLIYPVTDCPRPGSSYDVYGKDNTYGLSYDDMSWFYNHYICNKVILAAAPATLLVTAECDVLRDEGLAYMEKLESLGVEVSLYEVEGQIHGFWTYQLSMSDARETLHRVAETIKIALHDDVAHSIWKQKKQNKKMPTDNESTYKYIVVSPAQMKKLKNGRKTKKSVADRTPQYAKPLERSSAALLTKRVAKLTSQMEQVVHINAEMRLSRASVGGKAKAKAKADLDSLTSQGEDVEGADLNYVKFLVASNSLVPLEDATEGEGDSAGDSENILYRSSPGPEEETEIDNWVTGEVWTWRKVLKKEANNAQLSQQQKKKQFESEYKEWVAELNKFPRVNLYKDQIKAGAAIPPEPPIPPVPPTPEVDWVTKALEDKVNSPGSPTEDPLERIAQLAIATPAKTASPGNTTTPGISPGKQSRLKWGSETLHSHTVSKDDIAANKKQQGSIAARRAAREEAEAEHARKYTTFVKEVKLKYEKSENSGVQSHWDKSKLKEVQHQVKQKIGYEKFQRRKKELEQKKYFEVVLKSQRSIRQKLPKKAPTPRADGYKWQSTKPESWLANTALKGALKDAKPPAPMRYSSPTSDEQAKALKAQAEVQKQMEAQARKRVENREKIKKSQKKPSTPVKPEAVHLAKKHGTTPKKDFAQQLTLIWEGN